MCLYVEASCWCHSWWWWDETSRLLDQLSCSFSDVHTASRQPTGSETGLTWATRATLCGTLLLKLSNQPELYRPPRQDQNVSSLGSFPTHVWIESHSRFKGLEKLRETLMKSKTNSYWERILSCSFLQCTSLYSCSTCPELYLQRLWVQVPPEHECDLLSPSRCCYDQGCREVRIHEANL